jgi:hypothetical protein
MSERSDTGLRRAVSKWAESGASELGWPRPEACWAIEGRASDHLYMGPDERGQWSILQSGRVVGSFSTQSEARAYYKRCFARTPKPRQ